MGLINSAQCIVHYKHILKYTYSTYAVLILSKRVEVTKLPSNTPLCLHHQHRTLSASKGGMNNFVLLNSSVQCMMHIPYSVKEQL